MGQKEKNEAIAKIEKEKADAEIRKVAKHYETIRAKQLRDGIIEEDEQD